MSALFQFTAADVSIEGIAIDFPLATGWLDAQLEDAGARARRDAPAGRIAGRLSRSGADIVVRCRVSCAVELPCARCLEPAAVDVDADLSLLLRPAARGELRGGRAEGASRPGSRAEPEREMTEADADLDVYDGEKVVLDPFVREAILLELPNFPLCSEDCAGIRPGPEPAEHVPTHSGPAVDPRLAPLGAFRSKLGGPVAVGDLLAAAAERSAALGRKPILRHSAHRASKKKKR